MKKPALQNKQVFGPEKSSALLRNRPLVLFPVYEFFLEVIISLNNISSYYEVIHEKVHILNGGF